MISLASRTITNRTTPIITTTAILFTTLITTYFAYNHTKRKKQSKWLEQILEEDEDDDDDNNINNNGDNNGDEDKEVQSIVKHFESSLQISDPKTTINEANKKRTQSYYEKMRDGHLLQNLVPGQGGNSNSRRSKHKYNTLLSKRQMEMNRIIRFYKMGNKSHRAIVIMCDEYTSTILKDARDIILKPLDYTTDMRTKDNAWIPSLNIIPCEDMHVTVALPWWWHSFTHDTADKKANYELSTKLCNRFRQAVIKGMHHPFIIELERILLLGGKILVALWRTVGERKQGNKVVIDRHGDGVDPFIRLRNEVTNCFTNDDVLEPLTYAHYNKSNKCQGNLPRQHTILSKTPGLLSQDGFIHTTLCRLPLNCLSTHDVNLESVHRLCREVTATYCGHRMIVDKYRFIESVGAGGESNPCNGPIFDDVVYAPEKVNDVQSINVTTAGATSFDTKYNSLSAIRSTHTTTTSSSINKIKGDDPQKIKKVDEDTFYDSISFK